MTTNSTCIQTRDVQYVTMMDELAPWLSKDGKSSGSLRHLWIKDNMINIFSSYSCHASCTSQLSQKFELMEMASAIHIYTSTRHRCQGVHHWPCSKKTQQKSLNVSPISLKHKKCPNPSPNLTTKPESVGY